MMGKRDGGEKDETGEINRKRIGQAKELGVHAKYDRKL